MLQRIQSVYMLLSALAMSAGMYFLPVYLVNETSVYLKEDGLLLMMSGLCAGISIANVFNFKNRRLQVVLNRIAIILSFVLFGLLMWDWIGQPEDVVVTGKLGMAMPLINVILIVLANRGIQKDELLVRSADRLR
ncbi:DUF4293 domain-containing protein [Phaeocystidibacter luteus]|uniref:DUF4293 domain-containing protein n=1 Tax=Phaeocystidibacter luteus TaxID=911197 RepID=A0A6N6RMI9_9FLAO|nr:DUF4293 domain-containing protein [Phaeocystidibacter luteus]KAB2814800.1 DUF4293 domain-containing protein [Phaeocystidibacter luteus]